MNFLNEIDYLNCNLLLLQHRDVVNYNNYSIEVTKWMAIYY